MGMPEPARVSGRAHVPSLACRIRDKIDKILKSDIVLSSLVAMNAALQDNRFDVRPRWLQGPCS